MLCFDVNRLTDIDIFLVLILFMHQEMADPGGIRGGCPQKQSMSIRKKKKISKAETGNKERGRDC